MTSSLADGARKKPATFLLCHGCLAF